MDLTGKTIADRFEIHSRVGEGGMGTVYRAYDKQLKCDVALKIIRPELLLRDDARARLEREIVLTARLRGHQNVVMLFDRRIDQGEVYLVMEYIEGETLSALVRRMRDQRSREKADGLATLCVSSEKPLLRLDARSALQIARQCLEALEFAHNKGVLHRDIKPSNIMLTTSPQGALVVKLMDFGIAKAVGVPESFTALEPITQLGYSSPGTPPYMAPEQFGPEPRSDETDNRTDLYSLGITLYETLFLAPPFSGEPYAVRNGHLNLPPPIPKGFPSSLGRLLLKALSKKPSDRFQSAREFIAEIDKCLASPDLDGASRGGIAKDPGGVRIGTKRLVSVALAALSVAAAGAFVWVAKDSVWGFVSREASALRLPRFISARRGVPTPAPTLAPTAPPDSIRTPVPTPEPVEQTAMPMPTPEPDGVGPVSTLSKERELDSRLAPDPTPVSGLVSGSSEPWILPTPIQPAETASEAAETAAARGPGGDSPSSTPIQLVEAVSEAPETAAARGPGDDSPSSAPIQAAEAASEAPGPDANESVSLEIGLKGIDKQTPWAKRHKLRLTVEPSRQIERVVYSVDAASSRTVSGSGIDLPILDEGRHEIQVCAYDAGGRSGAGSYSFAIAPNLSPVLSIGQTRTDAEWTPDLALKHLVTARDDEAGALLLEFSTDKTNWRRVSTMEAGRTETLSVALGKVKPGTVRYSLRLRDKNGALSEPVECSANVRMKLLKACSIEKSAVGPGEKTRVSFELFHPDYTVVTVRIGRQAAKEHKTSPAILRYEDYLKAGTCDVTLVAEARSLDAREVRSFPVTVLDPPESDYRVSLGGGNDIDMIWLEDADIWLGRTEITVAQFVDYLNGAKDADGCLANVELWPILSEGNRCMPKPGKSQQPMNFVSAAAARKFCAWLSSKTGQNYALPTPEEWNLANPDKKIGTDAVPRIEPYSVRETEADRNGLVGMSENVSEICADGRAYGGNFLSEANNPKALNAQNGSLVVGFRICRRSADKRSQEDSR